MKIQINHACFYILATYSKWIQIYDNFMYSFLSSGLLKIPKSHFTFMILIFNFSFLLKFFQLKKGCLAGTEGPIGFSIHTKEIC
jgi:hypothetical protein